MGGLNETKRNNCPSSSGSLNSIYQAKFCLIILADKNVLLCTWKVKHSSWYVKYKKHLCYFFIANIKFYGVKVWIFYRIAFYVVLIKLIVTLKTATNWTQINFQKQLCQNNVIEWLVFLNLSTNMRWLKIYLKLFNLACMVIIMVKLKWDIDFGTRTFLGSQNHERYPSFDNMLVYYPDTVFVCL